jgi:hypothetical protein
VRTPIWLCAAALERSSSEVSSGILIRGNYKKKKRTENDRAKYLPENTSRAENIYAENKRK